MTAKNYFEKHQLIRFHHCDPAGIVFYPEYLVIIDELIEDWFTEGMKTSFADLHAVERIGIPAARIEVDFLSPSKIGDVLWSEPSIADVYVKGIKIDPKAVWVVNETRFYNQRNELVALSRNTGLRHRAPEEVAAEAAKA